MERYRVEVELAIIDTIPPERRTAIKRELRRRFGASSGVELGPEERGGHVLHLKADLEGRRQDHALQLALDRLEGVLDQEGVLGVDRVWGPVSVRPF